MFSLLNYITFNDKDPCENGSLPLSRRVCSECALQSFCDVLFNDDVDDLLHIEVRVVDVQGIRMTLEWAFCPSHVIPISLYNRRENLIVIRG